MRENQILIKEGIKAHFIKTDLFKTNLIYVMLTTKLERETVTKNALIPFLLRRGTNNLKTQSELNKKFEEMYGATFDCGIDKIGDNQALKFFIETINDKYTLSQENLLEESLDVLFDIVFNPLMKDGKFNEEYLKIEKENLKKVIEAKIDNKALYTLDRCIENMYEDKGFGLYKYGYLEDVDKIDNSSISSQYKNFINNAKIDIFISGNFDELKIQKFIENKLNNISPRKEDIIINNFSTENKQKVENVKEIQEEMNITQGKLVIGLDVLNPNKDIQNAVTIYNAILGGSANSFLFQNVREKAGLAYTARSNYNKMKSNIFISCGIEIPNYEKAVNIIKEQLENLKIGNFSEDDLLNAKRFIISGIKTIEAEQDTEIVFYIGQEIAKQRVSIDEYITSIEGITREDLIEAAQNIQINTIFFLKGEA